MDVAAVVAGRVLAQGVKGEVAHRHVLGGVALQVAQQARAERLERHPARVHEEFQAFGPGDLAAHHAERVAALETHELMQEVHERMCTALGEVRNEKLKVKDQK